jgi:hypothetical protein
MLAVPRRRLDNYPDTGGERRTMGPVDQGTVASEDIELAIVTSHRSVVPSVRKFVPKGTVLLRVCER